MGRTTAEFYALPEGEQQLQIEAHDIESGICHQHGGPYDECTDEKRQWFPQRTVCHAAMEVAAANWMYDDLHEKEPYHNGDFTSWSKDRSRDHPYSARDGVTIWVAQTDINPNDKFLSRVTEVERLERELGIGTSTGGESDSNQA